MHPPQCVSRPGCFQRWFWLDSEAGYAAVLLIDSRGDDDDTLDVWAAFVKYPSFHSFSSFLRCFALGFGHGFRVAYDHAGASAQDFTDRPGAVVIRKEDFSDALLFGTVVPTAQQGEMVAQEGEVVRLGCFLLERA